MADKAEIAADIENYASVSFSKSGGPGGQNVNKLNTNVLLTMKIELFECLSAQEKGLLRRRLGGRINSSDELFVQAREERSQLRNRQLAVARMVELVSGGIAREKMRRKTKPSAAASERRLAAKKRRTDIKKQRGRVSSDG